ncbi:MAG: phosphoethanolamine--lipid A transferase [Pseudomonadota bacterium]
MNSRRFGTRLALPLPVLNLCVALWLLALLNVPFWRTLWQAVEGWDASRAVYLVSLPVFVVLWVWLALECLTWGRAAKPVLGILLLLSAAAAYYMNAYAVVFDRTMITNIMDTDHAESLELVNLKLIVWLLVLGVVPIFLLSRVYVPRYSWRRKLITKALTLGVLIVSVIVVVAPFFHSYATLLSTHHELRLFLVPTNYLSAAHAYVKARMAVPIRLEQMGTDATRSSIGAAGSKPRLTVLVIGETARAANFTLNGYSRATTPQLSAEAELINFRQVRSCGTSTAVSLPCLFLDGGRSAFSDTLASRRENLLDVLQRAGLTVLWRDNNSGCKELCDRVPRDDLTVAKVAALCGNGECHDEILLYGLQDKLDTFDRDTVVVLHMKGSHGPAYHLRYPATFEHFKPVCTTTQFDRCEHETIVNAYDNTLRYTDHVLAQTIALLRRNTGRFDTAMIYVSDHGESLGERGLYLHGLPYSIAPTEQTHVPMLMWLSQATESRLGIDAACLRGKQDEALSHDNFYHSVLGLTGVQTKAYRAERDMFRSCRGATL